MNNMIIKTEISLGINPVNAICRRLTAPVAWIRAVMLVATGVKKDVIHAKVVGSM